MAAIATRCRGPRWAGRRTARAASPTCRWSIGGRTLRIGPAEHGWNNNAMTVGGGTRVYGAQAWRFTPDDLRMASRYGVPEGSALADWPIDYADLEPFYSRAEWEIGVSGATGGDPWAGGRSREYPMAPLPGTLFGSRLAGAATRLGISTLPVPLLINSREYLGRSACVQCAQCVGFACAVDAKNGSHNTTLSRAFATGRCAILTGARVERIQPSVTDLVARLLAEAGVAASVTVPRGVEAVRRVGDAGSFLFLLNHGVDAARIDTVSGVDLLSGGEVGSDFTLAGGACAVVRER